MQSKLLVKPHGTVQGRTQGEVHESVPSPYNMGPLGERARTMAEDGLKDPRGPLGGAKRCLVA